MIKKCLITLFLGICTSSASYLFDSFESFLKEKIDSLEVSNLKTKKTTLPSLSSASENVQGRKFFIFLLGSLLFHLAQNSHYFLFKRYEVQSPGF